MIKGFLRDLVADVIKDVLRGALDDVVEEHGGDGCYYRLEKGDLVVEAQVRITRRTIDGKT